MTASFDRLTLGRRLGLVAGERTRIFVHRPRDSPPRLHPVTRVLFWRTVACTREGSITADALFADRILGSQALQYFSKTGLLHAE